MASAWRLLLGVLGSPRLPAACRRAVVRSAAAALARRLAQNDARAALAAPYQLAAGTPIYLLDGFHGGIPFWDWLLPQEGLWASFLWPAVGGALLRRGLPVTLELDGYTFEALAERSPGTLVGLREAVARGCVELVNGTYAQPFLDTLSGEMVVRQLWYGLRAIEQAFGARVTAYASQEPCFCAQLPQILRSFGYRWALVRTHWAAFGCEPAFDAPLVRWRGPDGSELPAVPRHSWQGYESRKEAQPGVVRGTLSGAHASHWSAADLAGYHEAAAQQGTAPALLSKLEDLAPLDAPTPQAPILARTEGVRLSSLASYCEAVLGDRPLESLPSWQPAPDGFCLTLPWGLEGDRLLAAREAAEAALQLAERAAAVAFALGGTDAGAELEPAWKKLLLGQHHDLQVCGPWRSAAHGKSMSAVGCDLCGEAAAGAHGVLRRALAFLLRQGEPAGLLRQPVVVFNPHPRPLRALVHVPERGALYTGGTPLPAQPDGEGMLVLCELPALGWRILDLRPASAAAEPGPADGLYGEGRLSAACSEGRLTIWMGDRLLLHDGLALSYALGGTRFFSRAEPGAWEVVGTGPLFTRWRARGSLGEIRFSQELTLYRHLPRIDIETVLDFGDGALAGPQPEDGEGYYTRDEEKVCVLLPLGRGTLLRSLPFLIAEARARRFAMTGLAAVEGEDGSLALLTPGSRGCVYDPDQGLLQLVLAWSPRRWIYDGGGRPVLHGRHTFRCALLPYEQREEALAGAELYRLPPVAIVAEERGPVGAGERSLLEIGPAMIRLSALFAHDGALYLRLWNASTAVANVELRSAIVTPGRWLPVDLWLRAEASCSDPFTLSPWGVRTLRYAGPEIRRT
ncbi:MAG: hypothetical protein K6V36_07675 [Anaerolineae bacterium]|nr:hypothetical protein [Anaerolineae bacterium]